ncbi:MAG: hypothetical protein K2H09_09550 [Treponemataceae bacterium]|nr:hypothetical protein [Treponemataceae bacterium]
MKRATVCIAAVLFGASAAFSQVMPYAGVENNVWTGFGKPLSGGTRWYGIIDCLQARVDVFQFTIEGMVNWGLPARVGGNDFKFALAEENPLFYSMYNGGESYLSGEYNGWNGASFRQDPYYVNFLWHPLKGLDVGVGTKLNWTVGRAPASGSWYWEPDAHVSQGGFSTAYDDRIRQEGRWYEVDAPGSADVVGFVHYANKYARDAIGARYAYAGDDFRFQAGAAIPDMTELSENFALNLGAEFGFKGFSIATAWEGLFQQDGNLYVGASFGVKSFLFDVWFAWDSIDTKKDNDDMAWGTGLAMTFGFPKIGLTIRPEGGINWFEHPDYTPAGYVGGLVRWDFAKRMSLQAWVSYAIGSKDRKWDDNSATKDWIGGHIFDIRPEFTFNVTERHSLSAYVDIQNRVAFDKESRTCFSTGVFWTYRIGMSDIGRK